MHTTAVIELHYLPTIQYMSKLVQYDKVIIETGENYQKGSYRNRTNIIGGNGLQRLSIPLLSGKNEQQNILDVKIAWHDRWPSTHWKSIQSAYGKAPFYEFYADELAPLFEEKIDSLFDFNYKLLETLIDLAGIRTSVEKGSYFDKELSSEVVDLRSCISPKTKQQKEDLCYATVKYAQVFEDRHGFVPNVSFLDLLFCTGPQSVSILQKSIICE